MFARTIVVNTVFLKFSLSKFFKRYGQALLSWKKLFLILKNYFKLLRRTFLKLLWNISRHIMLAFDVAWTLTATLKPCFISLTDLTILSVPQLKITFQILIQLLMVMLLHLQVAEKPCITQQMTYLWNSQTWSCRFFLLFSCSVRMQKILDSLIKCRNIHWEHYNRSFLRF